MPASCAAASSRKKPSSPSDLPVIDIDPAVAAWLGLSRGDDGFLPVAHHRRLHPCGRRTLWDGSGDQLASRRGGNAAIAASMDTARLLVADELHTIWMHLDLLVQNGQAPWTVDGYLPTAVWQEHKLSARRRYDLERRVDSAIASHRQRRGRAQGAA